MIKIGDYVIQNSKCSGNGYGEFFPNKEPGKIIGMGSGNINALVLCKNGYIILNEISIASWVGLGDTYIQNIEQYFGQSVVWLTLVYLEKVYPNKIQIFFPNNSSIEKAIDPELNKIIQHSYKKYIITEVSIDKKVAWVEPFKNGDKQ